MYLYEISDTTVDLKSVLGFYLAGPISVGGIPEEQI